MVKLSIPIEKVVPFVKLRVAKKNRKYQGKTSDSALATHAPRAECGVTWRVDITPGEAFNILRLHQIDGH